jgi:hypothetical protein
MTNIFPATIIEKLDPKDSMQHRKVETKAMRNAIRRHLAGMLETVQEFLAEAQKDGALFAPADAPTEMQEAVRSAEAQRAARAAAKHVPIGQARAGAWLKRLGDLKDRLDEEGQRRLQDDWNTFQSVRFGGGKIAAQPETMLPELEDRLKDWTAALTGDGYVPDQEPAEAPGYDAAGQPIPTEQDIKEELALLDLSETELTDLYRLVGWQPGTEMTPDHAKHLREFCAGKRAADKAREATP